MKVLKFLRKMSFLFFVSVFNSVFADGMIEDKNADMKGKENLEMQKEVDSINFPEQLDEAGDSSDVNIPDSGKLKLIHYVSPKEIYILIDVPKSKHITKKEVVMVSMNGLDHLTANITGDDHSELVNIYETYNKSHKYQVVKRASKYVEGEPLASVILTADNVNINNFFKKSVQVNYLPKEPKENFSWKKQNAYFYNSTSAMNWKNKKDQFQIWLHRKGDKW